MAGTNFSKQRKIPSVTTRKSSPTTTNFAKGIYTYKPNDTMDFDEIYLAQNARFDRIGEYKTRQGLAKLCEPIGKNQDSSNYTSSYDMTNTTNVAQNISVSADRLYSIELTASTTNGGKSPITVTSYELGTEDLINSFDPDVLAEDYFGQYYSQDVGSAITKIEFTYTYATNNMQILVSMTDGSQWEAYNGNFTAMAVARAEHLGCSGLARFIVTGHELTADAYDYVDIVSTYSVEYGILQATLLDQNGNVVAISCRNDITTVPTNKEFIFKDSPMGTGETLTLKLSTQGTSQQVFQVAVLSGTTNLMYKVNTATPGYITNLFEANIDGTKTILFTFKTSLSTTLYRMSSTGTVTSIRTLPAGVTKVRFSQNVNKIRYADGKEGPRIINPSTWADSAIPTTDLKSGETLTLNVSNILAGTQDNMMYFDADTTTQAVWTYPYGFEYAPEADYETSATLNEYVPGATTTTTINTSTLTPVSSTHLVSAITVGDIIIDDNNNYGEVTTISGSSITVTAISHLATAIDSYDAFDRDFRQNFPAIKTGDPLTAMFNLGGVVYFLTRRNKYYMYSQTADVWTQQAASAQHGTFSQEATVCDLNYAYYANDDGIYIFDGSTEASLTQNTIQGTYDAIQGKESITLELYSNRLYVFYSSQGNGTNDSCLVYNINLKLWESFDTGLPLSATIGRQTASNRFICGSSHFGQLYSFETTTNAYADLGAPLAFDLETAYLHFGTPSQLHRITKWRPEFAKVAGDYTVKCGYALDFTDDVKYAFSINLQNQTPVNEHYVWDNPPVYGNPVTPTKLTMVPQVNGQFYRCQMRYQHHAAYEPVSFKAQTLQVETQRLR